MSELKTKETFQPIEVKVNTKGEVYQLEGKRIHFVGIGGCGMSGLARIVQAEGAMCSGTDMTESEVTRKLMEGGIDVGFEQTGESVPAGVDMLVVSAAITEAHPEVMAARARGIRVVKYAQLLGGLMYGRTGVAIAGTHGKSTTTAMLAHTLIATERDPSFIVGATCEQIGGGVRVGRKDVLIAEACEYDRSFHNFFPTHSVILNCEEDHLDIYGTVEGVVEAFAEFAERTAIEGSLLIEHENPYRETITKALKVKVETIGYDSAADWVIETDSSGIDQQVSIRHEGMVVCEFNCRLPGKHMASNGAVAAVTGHRLGASWEGIGEALSEFGGLDRRMDYLGEVDGIKVIDDYGHHPTEIDKTLRALRDHYAPEKVGGRLVCVFQPHQHSRTRFLLDKFAKSFEHADVVIVPQIYFVRDSDEDRRAVGASDLVKKVQAHGVLAVHIDDFGEISSFLKKWCQPGDLLVVMGAGPVWKIAYDFTGRGY